jgi:hypothetical protein
VNAAITFIQYFPFVAPADSPLYVSVIDQAGGFTGNTIVLGEIMSTANEPVDDAAIFIQACDYEGQIIRSWTIRECLKT